MLKSNFSHLTSIIMASIFLNSLSVCLADNSLAENQIDHVQLTSLLINFPNDEIPPTRIGDLSRGSVRFGLPDNSDNPDTSVGGGSRGSVRFGLPDNSDNPDTSVGGGSRGSVRFGLPDNSDNPDTSVGGGSRGSVRFGLPDNSDNPDTSVGGGSRGEQEELTLLTALLPTTKNGLTVSSHPTIFVYLPPLGTEKVFFSMQDEDGNSFYYTNLKVPSQGGIIMVKIPSEMPSLSIDKNYLWYFAPIEAGGRLLPNNYAVVGWIKRIATNLNEDDFVSNPITLATEYGKLGVWYDTLRVLAEAKQADPNNDIFRSEWHDLLEQIKLEKLSSQPLIESF
jgi:hypothetical protein